MSDFVRKYLKRIDYQGNIEPTFQTLKNLQFAHLCAVPFENLSIHLQQPIELTDLCLETKILDQNRGGFCYELNGLFAKLLTKLGFKVRLLSAQVAREDGRFGRKFGHLTLWVKLSEDWLVDVGFGDSFLSPLKLEDSFQEDQGHQNYQLINSANLWTLYQGQDSWKPQYRFDLTPRKLTDFESVCLYNQTHPESIFKQRLICTIASPTGRVTLSDRKLIITENQQKRERYIDSKLEYQQLLKQYFKINLTHYSQEQQNHLLSFLFSK